MSYDFLYTILYVLLGVLGATVAFVFYAYRRVWKSQGNAVKAQDDMIERQKRMLEVQEAMLEVLKGIEKKLK